MRIFLAFAVLQIAVLFSGEPATDSGARRQPIEPNADEQCFIYLLNKARSDPPAYGKSIGLDLTGVAPQRALAVNAELMASSRFRANDMLKRDYFSHVDPDGFGPNSRALEKGYVLGKHYKRSKETNNIEAIAAGDESPADILKSLIIDDGVPDLGHRKQLLAMQEFHALAREIGVGIVPRGTAVAKFDAYCAIHAAARDMSGAFVTGVVYEDKNGNGAYDVGEGVAGAAITVDAKQVLSLQQGGFAMQLPRGPFVVRCEKDGSNVSGTASIILRGENVHVEFVSGKKFGIVDFVKGREGR